MLHEAIALHGRGEAQAEGPLYRAVLAEQLSNCEASHGLGTLLAQRGSHAQSLSLFQAALQSSDCRFTESYLNKQINVSPLFGHRPD